MGVGQDSCILVDLVGKYMLALELVVVLDYLDMSIVVEQGKDSLVGLVRRKYVLQFHMYSNVDLVPVWQIFVEVLVVVMKIRTQILTVDVLYIDSRHKGGGN